jgi:hypothetical protein
MNGTLPTSSVFSVGASVNTNGSGDNYVAYCFAEKQGYSKFGKYVGNGSGRWSVCLYRLQTCFYNGKEQLVLLMNGMFMIIGGQALTNNDALYASNVVAEDAGSTICNFMDIVSNGFKLRRATYSP